MELLQIKKENGIATVTLQHGKVNPLNEEIVEQLQQTFENFEKDEEVKVVVLTGQGKFFSFGFDIPGFMDYSKEEFTRYVIKFTQLYTYLFLFSKPVIAALNGHTIAGGCMIASACDYKIMMEGKAKISLNEITFGSTVFAGSVEMLKYATGSKNAEKILYSGKMYSAQEALELNLIDKLTTEENFVKDVKTVAKEFVGKDAAAFISIKKLLRKPVQEEMAKREKESIDEFIEIWYSDKTREQLRQVIIHS